MRDDGKMMAMCIASDKKRSLLWEEAPMPEPLHGEVLIKIAATAVNRADLLQRLGRYPPPKGVTDTMGLEASGTVVALGDGVESRRIGDEVCCLLAGGGYATFVACPAGQTLPIPSGLSVVEAAALPEAMFTSFLNLYMLGMLEEGQQALIHAGGSGIGTMAIQICKVLGNRAFVTASRDKLRRCRELGAYQAIDRAARDFVEVVMDETGGRGVDVILDPIGGSYLDKNIAALAMDGRLIVIGLLGGSKADLPLGKILSRRIRIVGSVLRTLDKDRKAEIRDAIVERIWNSVASHAIVPVIDRVLPLQSADKAHDLLKRNATFGKVVLQVD